VLASDVFDLTKIEQGHLSFIPTIIDLRPILHQALAISEGLKPMDSEVELDLDVPMEIPQIYADGDRVRQILINLLSNSLKFTPKGSVTIRGGLSEDGKFIILGVEDTGAGIPAADIPFIFERFRQAANQEKAGGYKGTGLGLAICKQLVEQHGGEIWVESEVGRGTTFYFSLPVVR
jgi:signal transduction histidine kinase